MGGESQAAAEAQMEPLETIQSTPHPPKMITNELIYKTERVTDLENKLMVTRGEGLGGGIDWEFGIDMYTQCYV